MQYIFKNIQLLKSCQSLWLKVVFVTDIYKIAFKSITFRQAASSYGKYKFAFI